MTGARGCGVPPFGVAAEGIQGGSPQAATDDGARLWLLSESLLDGSASDGGESC